MDRQAAENRITNTFNYPFDEQRFRTLTRDLFDDRFEEFKDSSWITGHIKKSFRKHIKKYKRIGKYSYHDGSVLDVIIVHLKKEDAIDRARTMQRNFIASYLKTRGEKEAAVVAYFTDNADDWRFSYVRMEYKEAVTESGKVKVKEELTPAKRYSFLVGKNEPNHTAKQQLLPLLQSDSSGPALSELKDAFSVETVTKQFYQDYKGLFGKLTVELKRIIEKDSKIKKEFKDKSIDTANFAKKLLGQIVFLYFLQKKGWLGVGKDDKGDFKSWGTGPKNFLRQIHEKKYIRYNNFFNDVLEPLFYEALATERPSDYYSRFNCKIPFLNGGLFEPIGEYNWQETDILINNDLFSEIFKTFDQYNFTVREDEPLEKEVAVDPEMLGKVFENLLPENLRKGQGAYYTPREIVHYMCQESLINYLDTAINTGEISLAQEKSTQGKLFGTPEPKQLGLKTTGYKTVIPRKDIENFICKGEFAIEHDTAKEEGTTSYKYQVDESIRKNAQLLDEKLKTIKICDPAIGSGAFPVGMMHEIIKARNVLTTYLEDKTKRSIYKFKRNCIQQSLYGVDIDPGAIDIAKLRLWLSLIVDEDDYHNIKALPNLDYKIMQGNSLIEEFHGISLNLEKEKKSEKPVNMQLFNVNKDLDKLIENLHNKQDRLFLSTHPEEKQLLKRKVEDAVVEIFHYELQRSNEEYFRELTTIEDKVKIIPQKKNKKEYYDKEKAKLDKRYKFDFTAVENELREMTRGNRVRNFFPWKLYFADVFRKNGGFDVVIANPPYVGEKGHKEIFRPIADSEFGRKYYNAKMDIFYFFFHKGIDIGRLSSSISFITTNYYITATGAKKLRFDFKNRTTIKKLINFNELKIFDSAKGQHNIITILEKRITDDVAETCITKRIDVATLNILNRILTWQDGETNYYKIKQKNLFEGSSNYIRINGVETDSSNPINVVLNKLKDSPKKLVEVSNINSGCDITISRITKKHLESFNGNFEYGDGVFVINDDELKSIGLNNNEKLFLKDFIKNSDIFPYRITFSKDKLIYIRWEDDIRDCPNLKKHLERFKKILVDQAQRYEEYYPWYALHRPRSQAIFESNEKILVPYRNKRNIFGYSTKSVYSSRDVFFITKMDNQYDLKFLVGLLNSKLLYFWLYNKGKRKGEILELYYKPLSEIPIKEISSEQQKPFIHLADQILAITKDDDYLQNTQKQAKVKALEAEIDQLVYKLYDLTPEEIKIVEGENK
jgi:adenine-specific DNA-methyltransferase